MEEREKDSVINNYQHPDKELWKGRATSNLSDPQYWYQQIECIAIDKLEALNRDTDKKTIGIVGYACDEGVRRNQGRVGAITGPIELRKKLATIPLHFDSKQTIDFGNIVCNDGNMEASQEKLSECITSLLNQNIFPIVIGGGHDVAFGHFMGIKKAKSIENKKIGIINFDAHFDLRPLEKTGNSGTPFSQINSFLELENSALNYFILGIQQQSNTKELFEIADRLGVHYILSEECYMPNIERIKKRLQTFIEANDIIYLTIDVDGFSSAYAPGVSASSSLGFSPHFVYELLKFLFESDKIISCDIAELNPEYDVDGITAHLAARLVDFITQIY